MKILITGAGGQLGTDCRNVLSDHILLPLTSAELDITINRQVQKEMARFQPDVVINCAAYTAVDRCEDDSEHCFAVNAGGPETLAAACAESGSRLIHISTDYVFAGTKPIPQPYREDDPTGPLSQYGKGKLAGEEAVRRHLDNHLIIRTAWLYGMGSGNFLKTMLRLTTENPKRILRVVDDQYGSLTWTWRLASQIACLLDSSLTGTIHATAEGYSTWYMGAKYFLEAMGLEHSLQPCTTADYPTPAHRPHNSILANSRLLEKGLNRMVPWQEDVALFARMMRQDASSHGS